MQLAKLRGANVIGLASESKFYLVKDLGAEHVFDYGKPGWSAKVLEVTGPQGVQVFLDSTGDLATEAFPLPGQFGRWIIYGARGGKQSTLPAETLWSMIEKNISLTGFNLGGNLDQMARALGELFRFAIDGSLRVDVTKYPLADAAAVHALFEGRKTTGKLAPDVSTIASERCENRWFPVTRPGIWQTTWIWAAAVAFRTWRSPFCHYYIGLLLGAGPGSSSASVVFGYGGERQQVPLEPMVKIDTIETASAITLELHGRLIGPGFGCSSPCGEAPKGVLLERTSPWIARA